MWQSNLRLWQTNFYTYVGDSYFFEFVILFLWHDFLQGIACSHTQGARLNSLQRHMRAQREPLVDHLAPLQPAQKASHEHCTDVNGALSKIYSFSSICVNSRGCQSAAKEKYVQKRYQIQLHCIVVVYHLRN